MLKTQPLPLMSRTSISPPEGLHGLARDGQAEPGARAIRAALHVRLKKLLRIATGNPPHSSSTSRTRPLAFTPRAQLHHAAGVRKLERIVQQVAERGRQELLVDFDLRAPGSAFRRMRARHSGEKEARRFCSRGRTAMVLSSTLPECTRSANSAWSIRCCMRAKFRSTTSPGAAVDRDVAALDHAEGHARVGERVSELVREKGDALPRQMFLLVARSRPEAIERRGDTRIQALGEQAVLVGAEALTHELANFTDRVGNYPEVPRQGRHRVTCVLPLLTVVRRGLALARQRGLRGQPRLPAQRGHDLVVKYRQIVGQIAVLGRGRQALQLVPAALQHLVAVTGQELVQGHRVPKLGPSCREARWSPGTPRPTSLVFFLWALALARARAARVVADGENRGFPTVPETRQP